MTSAIGYWVDRNQGQQKQGQSIPKIDRTHRTKTDSFKTRDVLLLIVNYLKHMYHTRQKNMVVTDVSKKVERYSHGMSSISIVILLLDTLLDHIFQIWILHGSRYPLLVIYLFIY